MAFKKTTAALALTCALVPAVSACTQNPSSPAAKAEAKQEATKSVASLTDQEKLTTSVTLATDPANLLKVYQVLNTGKTDPKSEGLVKAFAGATLRMEAQGQGGKKLKDAEKSDNSLQLLMDNSTVLHLLTLQEKVFLKADVARFASKTSLFSPEEVSQLKAVGTTPWMKALLGSEWLQLDDVLVKKATASEAKASSLNPQDARKMVEATQRAVNSTSTFTSQGEDKMLLEIPVKRMLEAEANELSTALGASFTAEDKADLMKLAQRFREDGKLKVNLIVKDDKLQEARLDVLDLATVVDSAKLTKAEEKKQVADLAALDLPVVVTFSGDAPSVKAPEKAQKVTESDLSSLGF